MQHHVILVPGFFGFSSLGNLSYFVGVKEQLTHRFAEHGLDVSLTEVLTSPTASIRSRAARVREAMTRVADETEGPLHVIGHSTGGLDARVAISPAASLPTDVKFDCFERLASVVTLSTPHYGTPLASFFGGAMGKPLLRLLAVASSTLLTHGKLPIKAAVKLGHILTRADDYLGLDKTLLDQVYAELLSDFSEERRQQLVEYVSSVSSDQSLIFQLTPAGCDLLNATSADPEKVRYGCVVARAARPELRHSVRLGHDVYAQWLGVLFRALYKLSSRTRPSERPQLGSEQEKRLVELFGELPDPAENDGIVPTLSQVWGEVIDGVQGDHLDLVGHYGPLDPRSPRADWFPSGSGFDAEGFERVWNGVADFITDEAVHRRAASGRGRVREDAAGGRQTVAVDA